MRQVYRVSCHEYIPADEAYRPSHVRQDGSPGIDIVNDIAIGLDGSVLLAGETYGPWEGVNEGRSDFAVVKLDAEGNET